MEVWEWGWGRRGSKAIRTSLISAPHQTASGVEWGRRENAAITPKRTFEIKLHFELIRGATPRSHAAPPSLKHLVRESFV